jgi:biopolymer transport protein ExbD
VKFKRNIKAEVGIDLTSLIDVVFLLLIFFMVTTTFTRQSNLLLNLPEADGSPAEEEAALRIEILVARDGSYTVNGRALPDNSFATLTRSLEELSAGDTTIPVTLTADADTTHQSVVTALDAVAQLGITRLSVATRRRSDN